MLLVVRAVLKYGRRALADAHWQANYCPPAPRRSRSAILIRTIVAEQYLSRGGILTASYVWKEIKGVVQSELTCVVPAAASAWGCARNSDRAGGPADYAGPSFRLLAAHPATGAVTFANRASSARAASISARKSALACSRLAITAPDIYPASTALRLCEPQR